MRRAILFSLITALVCLYSCKKPAGEGGRATITGKVYAKDYNSAFNYIYAQYYAPDEDVYIVYGDELSFGDRVRTNYDGTYVFNYLRPGKYKIYAYSKDSTGASVGMINASAASVAIIKEVEITEKKETVVVPEIEILK